MLKKLQKKAAVQLTDKILAVCNCDFKTVRLHICLRKTFWCHRNKKYIITIYITEYCMFISFHWLELKYRKASTNCNQLCAKDQSFIRREVYDVPSWAVGSKPCSDGTLSHAFSANFPLSLKCLFILSCSSICGKLDK